MESSIPCVLVASKADLPEAKQFHGMTPSEFCYKHRLPPPLLFSSVISDATNKNIFPKLAWAAVYPYVAIPPSTGLHLTGIVEFLLGLLISPPFSRHLNGSDLSSASFWLRVALGSAVVTVLGFAVYRALVRLKWPPIDWTLPPTPPLTPHPGDQTFETRPTRWKLLIPPIHCPAFPFSSAGSQLSWRSPPCCAQLFCLILSKKEHTGNWGLHRCFLEGPRTQSDS